MNDNSTSVAIRAIFGRNLRILSEQYPSVSEVCRQLNVNRAQYNRYLNGESYPRPDMLARICTFFGTDARILTEPLEDIAPKQIDLLTHPEIRDFASIEKSTLSEEFFPSGFYRFTRQSFLYPERFLVGLIYVYRRDGWTFIKGSEARKTTQDQGLPDDPKTRQFRGYVLRMENGVGSVISRRSAMTCTFNFLAPVASLNQNFWHGYAARTISEELHSTRVSRMVYEFLGKSTSEILSTARVSGFCDTDDLPAFHRRLLKVDAPFA